MESFTEFELELWHGLIALVIFGGLFIARLKTIMDFLNAPKKDRRLIREEIKNIKHTRELDQKERELERKDLIYRLQKVEESKDGLSTWAKEHTEHCRETKEILIGLKEDMGIVKTRLDGIDREIKNIHNRINKSE